MCTSSHGSKAAARLVVRVGFGLALAFTGFAHYQDPSYAESVGRGLGVLEQLGMAWGYILPGLMIVGGLLLAFGIYRTVAAYAASIALASIPAGLMLKSAVGGISLEDTMPPAMNALVWILVLMVAVKGSCGSSAACCCGPSSCACGDMPAPMKSAPAQPAVSMKPSAPAKKAMPVRKAPVKKSSKA